MFRYLVAAVCLIAAYYSALFARAACLFQQDTAASVSRALELVPYNADYAARLAAWKPDQQRELLTRAVELNPFEFRAWIQLGLIAELEQADPATAERDYLRAAEVNKMFLPKWTLANFYLRQGREAEFFHWAKLTLDITPHAPSPVFREMWLAAQDAAKIASYIPDRSTILIQYALFLSGAGRFNAIPPIIARLVTHPGGRTPEELGRDDLIGPIEDQLLSVGDVRDALQIWRSLSDARWIHLSVPAPSHPLTNGDFRSPFYGHGFDWVPASCPGASVNQDSAAGILRIELSGTEPEHCTLLTQRIPVVPGQLYHLQWRGAASGLLWKINSLQKELGNGGILEFRTPQHTDLLTVALEYARPPGSILTSGSFELRSVSIVE
ncbi:MAG TPA: hypothetical protein VFB14_10085 [Bryobacteraceae bacterium]|nr:hypothetical protein [Bryobacteraceae bacterium]